MKNPQHTTHNLQRSIRSIRMSVRIVRIAFLSWVVGRWLLVTPFSALAQGLPSGQPITLDVLDYVIFRVSTAFISVSVIFAMIFIIWSGITYMYAGADATKVTNAQNRLKSGIIGAAIILGVGVIIQTIASVVTLDFFCTVRVPIVGICIY